MKFRATVLLLFVSTILWAQNGYEIKVTLKPFKNQYIYLGHYYGKQLPIIDSVKLNDKSQGVFKGDKKLGGGIYLIGYPDRSHNFEMLVDKNQKFEIIADTSTVANKITFVNSPDNDQFFAYQKTMVLYGKEAEELSKKRAGSSAKDSIAITKQLETINNKVKNYRLDVMSKYPNSLLTTLLKAMKEPEVPQNDPAAKKDSMFAYHYFKKHYWDGVNFFDDRLVRTPFFENRIDKYFEQLIYPAADSVNKEIDWMMGYASASDEMQKFLLLKFVNRYLNQKYMWEDAIFVHLFEKYFSNKDYPWLNEKGKKLITDRAYSLMANIFGSPASDVDLPDTAGKRITLYGVQAPYTLLAIWDPTCGHCREMIPKLDTLYQTKWKALGMKMFGLAKETDGNKKDWMNFIHEHKLNDWVHVYYSKDEETSRLDAGVPSYSQLFDVQSFPTLYLLDKDKRIIAKKITEKQVDEILEFKQKNPKG
jgi:thiol-disulfide isomerase/thioredoxin